MKKSKVSFRFNGDHNIDGIKLILHANLTNVRTFIESSGKGEHYRIYVYALEDEFRVLKTCKHMQDEAVLDNTKLI